MNNKRFDHSLKTEVGKKMGGWVGYIERDGESVNALCEPTPALLGKALFDAGVSYENVSLAEDNEPSREVIAEMKRLSLGSKSSDLILPFEFDRTIDAWRQHGSYDGDLFVYKFNDTNKQVLISGDKIDAAYIEQAIERPRFGPYHALIPELSANPLFIESDYTIFVEISGKLFRVNRSGDGEFDLVPLESKP